MAFWEQDTVTYSNQNPKPDVEDSSKFIQSNFRQFLREFRKGGVEETLHYREQLMRNYEQRNYKIVIDFEDLNNWNNSLGEKFREHPMIYLPLFEAAAQEVVAMSKVPKPTREEMHDIQVQIINLARSEISIRQLQSDHIAQLVRVPGIIISSTKPSCKAKKITLMCSNCRATRVIESARAFGTIQLPRNCENSTNENNEKACPVDPFMILADKSEFLDVQKLKLQENPEDIPTGEMPRHIWLFCERNLVNKVKPGSRVNVIGIYKIFDSKLFNNNNNNGNGKNNKRNDCHDAAVRKPYIEVVGFEEINATEKKGTFQPEEEEEIRELSRNSNIQEMISNSIAPAIWSNEDVKKAIACLLFGGSRKLLPDGMRLRGDINVLLLGDPSVAKSQFLKFVHQVAPIGVYTSGKGSSAAGLTASVLRDPGTGDFHLEGGAMVLADNGVVCIDEFDKMREQDRVAIHEAMEQQTISIAKAGITTILNSRTSVLAAANPIFGRYDDMRTTNENIEFETTILSRFDLIFIIRDVKDKNRDARLAQHIMQLHINVNNIEDKQNEAPISPQLLAKYISYAKHKIYPRLSNNAAEMLKNHYVSFRDEARRYQDQTGQQNAIPLTVRQLESLIRIAESLAKMELSKEANENHVKEAVRLFKVSTLKAARQSTTTTEQQLLNSNNSQYIQDIQKAEKRIKRRIPVGSALSVQKLIRDMLQKNVSESTTHRALAIMHARGEVEYKNKAKQILRLK